MKIYTGGGDRGKTSLFSGERVFKHHPRIALCGEIDELNSMLGVLVAMLPADYGPPAQDIHKIQSHLLVIGSWISTTSRSPARADIQRITDSEIGFLEGAIDRMTETLPELKEFILPGGHLSAAFAHVARSVCRRVERQAVALVSEDEKAAAPQKNTSALVYLNRLSDYLFVLARYLNRIYEMPDIPWRK